MDKSETELEELLDNWSWYAERERYPDDFLKFFESYQGTIDDHDPDTSAVYTYQERRYFAWIGWFASRYAVVNKIQNELVILAEPTAYSSD